MARRALTRTSSCGPAGLPVNLACEYCVPSIQRSKIEGIPPKKIKKCLQPWDFRWANHREIAKVKKYHEVESFLRKEIVKDYIEYTSLYPSRKCNKNRSTEITATSNETTATEKKM